MKAGFVLYSLKHHRPCDGVSVCMCVMEQGVQEREQRIA